MKNDKIIEEIKDDLKCNKSELSKKCYYMGYPMRCVGGSCVYAPNHDFTKCDCYCDYKH